MNEVVSLFDGSLKSQEYDPGNTNPYEKFSTDFMSHPYRLPSYYRPI